MQYQQEKLEIVSREKILAKKEADFYRRQVEIASRTKNVASSLSASTPKMPKIPEFRGSSIGFTGWISWISDLFENYQQLTDFNRRMMVVESLKEEARAWHDAEPDSSTTSWEALKNALLRHYVAKSENTLSIAMLRQQIDSDIRRFLPEIQNETFASFEQRLKIQFQELQTKSASRSNTVYRPAEISTSMDLDTISAPIRRTNNYSRPVSPSAFRPRSPKNFRNRNTHPHVTSNSTMSPAQFEQCVKNYICFACGKKGNLKTMSLNNNRQFRNFNIVENTDNIAPPKPPDKLYKTVSFSDPPTTDIKYISDSDSPDALIASRLPFYDLPTEKLTATHDKS
ncbi:hypothetical protein AYI70_g10798 [Smittium culicis]|uniref:Retrotransposon gag domain-containing protein n=1 Tax=Smittium culicis TaxID=133412 RepID=A0A1R1X516_9FUNG|nr:hypothetical protein AYI70_g10798 [Smittium culicis]